MLRALLAILLVTTLPSAAGAEAPDPLTYTCKPVAATSKLRVTVAPDASLRDLATWLTGFSCKHVVFGADVAKHATRLTIISSRAMTPREATQLFVDAVEATGLVVVQKRDTVIIKLGAKMPRGCPDVAVERPASPPVVDDANPSSDDDLRAEIAAGIRELDATHREIKRTLVDKILANPMAIAKGARVVPAIKNGKPHGFKLYAIRPATVYARLGLVNGDTVTAVNGHDLTSADKALEVYTLIRGAKRLELTLERRGKPLTLVITVK